MDDTWGIDDSRDLQLHARRLETVQQTDASPEHYRDQIDGELIAIE